MPKQSSAKKILTRQEQQNLDVEIGFIEGVIRRDPQYVEALQILGDAYTKRGKFAEGLQVDEQLARLRPDDSHVQYNLACSYALTEQFDAAVLALENALGLGYDDFKLLARDPDLAKLRKHPLFKKIRAQIRSLKTRTR